MANNPISSLAVYQATAGLFYYWNTTSQIQVIKVEQKMPQRIEKVVFPGERILFYSTAEAFLDIHTPTSTHLSLLKRIPCSQLKVLEPGVNRWSV